MNPAPASAEASALPWYLVYTKPRQEHVAVANLQQQGFDTYLPLCKMFKRSAEAAQAVLEPMFPRYLFFRPARASQSIAAARSTRGVMSLVRFGHEPATLADDTLGCIRALEARQAQVGLAEISPFQPGQVVRLRDPALCGLEGLVKAVSSRRVAVLLELLGRPMLVQVAHHQLAVA